MGTIGQPFVDGLSVAAILLIAALGLSISFGVMKVINMAHGELIMIGAYTKYLVSTVAGFCKFSSLNHSFQIKL
jgi:urea transport system permease protein